MLYPKQVSPGSALPRRQEIHNPGAPSVTTGERIADKASNAIGSWRFILIQTILVILWVAINLTGILLQWDPYPFILLNLMFSVQAAYTGPILLLAGNRAAQKDRAMACKDDEEIGLLLSIQQEQLEILRELQAKGGPMEQDRKEQEQKDDKQQTQTTETQTTETHETHQEGTQPKQD